MEVTGTSQRRLLALLSAPDLMWRGGGTCVWGCWGGGCVKVASDKGGNGTAGLVITMGHGEGREQAGSVNKVQMRARGRFYLT